MEGLTIEQIKKIVDKQIKHEERQHEYAETYRKTDKGRQRHNINSRRTYYRQKLKTLEGIQELTARQKKYKNNWEQNLLKLTTPLDVPVMTSLTAIYLENSEN
tara:strand:+ start:454 stop:762 length:309 start_codon:yes stop_codon:yes gene_type:complete